MAVMTFANGEESRRSAASIAPAAARTLAAELMAAADVAETGASTRVAPMNPQRVLLALQALYQIEALVPIAQQGGDPSKLEEDALLGLLGRVRHMNGCAMWLLQERAPKELASGIEDKRLAILGCREDVSHG